MLEVDRKHHGHAWRWFTEETFIGQKIEALRKAIVESGAWNWTIDAIGSAWDWLLNTTWAEKVEDMKGWLGSAWNWTVDVAGSAWDWFKDTKLYNQMVELKNLVTDSKAWKWTMDAAVPAVVEGGKMVIKAVVETAGKMYDAIKKGFATGDWSDFFSIAADCGKKACLWLWELNLPWVQVQQY